MADPATTAAAGGFIAGAAIASFANQIGVPVPVLISAVVGATVAVSVSDRVKWSAAGIWAGLVSFALALCCGIVLGRGCGSLLVQGLHKFSFDLDKDVGYASCALVLSVLGQSVILPAVAKRFGAEIENRGAAK